MSGFLKDAEGNLYTTEPALGRPGYTLIVKVATGECLLEGPTGKVAHTGWQGINPNAPFVPFIPPDVIKAVS